MKIKKHVVSITLPSEYDVDKQYPCWMGGDISYKNINLRVNTSTFKTRKILVFCACRKYVEY
ncbi:hypothetical protein [Lysinibacillus sp. Bpr_S20]|uniref:hypothetical protein n=1 Tax=Lysinibacillus sp. Bpr_S20 TaxID=2933964 RepID=UPI0020120315|nr:hypothetical protein [Lysinibacillus sp. Bpr_S20]MCL1700376.1 hypothetical protein [Lysinibacillus sp. Bpr_S20]